MLNIAALQFYYMNKQPERGKID